VTTFSSQWVKWALIATAVVVTAAVGYTAWSIWSAYRTVEGISQLEFDPAQTREELSRTVEPEPEPVPVQEVEPETVDELRSFLIVGTDNRPGFPGDRADVIIVALVPGDERPPVLFSLPRDLWIESPCIGTSVRINELLAGCGSEVTGPELLAVAVEDFIDNPIDHFALIDFAGFESVVDAFGGVGICLEYAIRDPKVDFEGTILPAGCSNATGAQALAWVRSRRTLEYVDGIGWRTQPGVNDLVRNQRQQDLLFALLGKVGSFRDVTRLGALAQSVASAVVLDDDLSVKEAVLLAWQMRALEPEDVIRLTVPVEYHITGGGASVLRPTGDFADMVRLSLTGLASADSNAA